MQTPNIIPTSCAKKIKSSHQKILHTSKGPEQKLPCGCLTDGAETKSRAAKSAKEHRQLPTSKAGICCPRSLLEMQNLRNPTGVKGEQR